MTWHYYSSSDEDDLINIPPALPPIQQEDDASNILNSEFITINLYYINLRRKYNLILYCLFIDQNVLPMLDPVLGIMQRIEHIKVNNYIENVVIYYTNVDFIMHFRLSRQV